jgi:hypothetical protein
MTQAISAFVSTLRPSQVRSFVKLVDNGHISVGDSKPIRTPADIEREALANLDYRLAVQEVVNG